MLDGSPESTQRVLAAVVEHLAYLSDQIKHPVPVLALTDSEAFPSYRTYEQIEDSTITELLKNTPYQSEKSIEAIRIETAIYHTVRRLFPREHWEGYMGGITGDCAALVQTFLRSIGSLPNAADARMTKMKRKKEMIA